MKKILLMIAVVALVGCGKKEPVQPSASNPEATKPEPTKGINQTSKVKIGTPIWEFKTGDLVLSSPAIGSDGTVYVGSLPQIREHRLHLLRGGFLFPDGLIQLLPFLSHGLNPLLQLNLLDRNLGVQAMRGRRLPDQVLPFDPNDGAAFWWANGRNTLTRNVAVENEELTNTRRIDTVNYALGTQTIGIKYKFTEKTGLIETAERIHKMGSNLMKFSMGKRCMGEHYSLPKNDAIRSLVDLAGKEPSVKGVLDMPFAYYHIWVSPFAHSDATWVDGLSDKERDDEYKEVYDLAKYLLKVYSGTGKTFFLGHWEGDWYLHPNYNRKLAPTSVVIKGMIDWLNIRQKAVDDARRKTQAKDVYIYHYTEVNLVQKGMKGGKCLVNNVLPKTNVDYVSYSSYDTINPHKGNVGKALHDALDYIESKLPPKAGIKGKRVFIGEYGFPLTLAGTPQKQDLYSQDVCLAALEWGCPFVLYWEIYCNEKPKGKHSGFWLIDDKNRKQPFYYTLQSYYKKMKLFVAEFRKKHGRLPTDNEVRKKAVEILKQDVSKRAKSEAKDSAP